MTTRTRLNKLDWKRGQRSETDVSHRMHYVSRCELYRLTRSTSQYEKTKHGRPVVRWYAERRFLTHYEWIDGKCHRSRAAAVRVCELHLQEDGR